MAAASGAKGTLTFTNVTAYLAVKSIPSQNIPYDPWYIPGYNGITSIAGNTTVQLPNSDGIQSVTSITLTITVSDSVGLLAVAPTVVSGSGWTAGTGSVSNGIAIYSFSWLGSIAPSGNSGKLEFSLPGDGSNVTSIHLPKNVVMMASSPQATGVQVGITVN